MHTKGKFARLWAAASRFFQVRTDTFHSDTFSHRAGAYRVLAQTGIPTCHQRLLREYTTSSSYPTAGAFVVRGLLTVAKFV